MSRLGDKQAARRCGAAVGFVNDERSGARLALIGPMEGMAAWRAQLVGIAIFFTILAGLSGFRREQVIHAASAWQAASWQALAQANVIAPQLVLKTVWSYGSFKPMNDAPERENDSSHLPPAG